MPAVKLNWQTAEVKDGELTVELENELPEGWKQSFESTATGMTIAMSTTIATTPT